MHHFILLLPAAALAAVTTHTTIDSAASAVGLTQQLSSFGVDLFATKNTPAAALQHAACVMDQYLDQDRDGVADDPNVVSALTARQAAMIMGATGNDIDDVFDAIDDNGGSFGDRALQDVYASETAYFDGASYFDASLEEVLHLITSVGYANAYPSAFGEYSGTTLADAVDAVIGDCEMSWECGGGGADEDGDEDDGGDDAPNTDDPNAPSGEAFCEQSGFSEDQCKSYDSAACECDWDGGQCWWQGGTCGGRRLDEGCEDYSDGSFVQGSCTGKFHYSDTSCDYGCLITEGLYWGVSSLLGAQEDRCGSIDNEWELCTPALMRSDAPALSTLIDTMGITVLPDGNCDVDVATDDNAAYYYDSSSTLPAMATPTTNLVVEDCGKAGSGLSAQQQTALSTRGFTKCVFGPFDVLVAGTSDYPDSYMLTAGVIVAEILDQDKDGRADDPNVVCQLSFACAGEDAPVLQGAPTRAQEEVGDGLGEDGFVYAFSLQTHHCADGGCSAAVARDIITEEAHHMITQIGYSQAYPAELGMESWDSVACAEMARASCVTWRHPENTCPSPGSHTDPPLAGTCNDPGCDCVEWFHQVILVLAGQVPGWTSDLLPTTAAALRPTLSSEFTSLVSDPAFHLLQAPLTYAYDVPLVDDSRGTPAPAPRPAEAAALGSDAAAARGPLWALLLLCLGTTVATLWDGCDWIESDSNTDGQQSVGSAASPDDCIAMVQAQCPTATIANIDESGSGGCWCQYGFNPTPDSLGYMSCVLHTLPGANATNLNFTLDHNPAQCQVAWDEGRCRKLDSDEKCCAPPGRQACADLLGGTGDVNETYQLVETGEACKDENGNDSLEFKCYKWEAASARRRGG